jgi:replication factor C small subunit
VPVIVEGFTTSPADEVMWTEKYRPRNLDEVINQKDAVKSLSVLLHSPSTIPHLLFSGPPGTGKTTVALCIAQQILGPSWRRNTLELNASDERGIQMVRDRVKTFSRTATGSLMDIPINIIILDECDQMTSEAQTALRRIMETSSRNSRFILIANYSGKIIEPIQSRCAIFRFSAINGEDIGSYLKEIAEKEHIKLLDSGLKALIDFSNGDLRRSINTLQAASSLNKEVNDKVVHQVVGEVEPSDVRRMLEKALEGNFKASRDTLFTLMFTNGFSGNDLLRQIHRQIYNLDLSEVEQIDLTQVLAEYDFRLVEGANDDIQLSAFLAQVAKLHRK